jgi:hypothetical protein
VESKLKVKEEQEQETAKLLPEFEFGKAKKRIIFQVDEGHRSQYTATKYRVDLRHFLDFIKIHNLQVLLDLGKEAIQELVIKYARSMRDNPEKKYSRCKQPYCCSSLLHE